ncbi:MAG: DUF4388 domain-containing protein [Myxococcota bacterium]
MKLAVLESDQINRLLVLDRLRELGHETREYDGVHELLQSVERHEVDAVLTNLGRLDMNGFEIVANIQRIDPAVAVLVMSVDDDDSLAVHAARVGAAGFVKKPIRDFRALAKKVEEAVDKAPARRKALADDLKGSIEQFAVTDLLQMMHMMRKTGTLDVIVDGDSAQLCVRDGNVVGARYGLAFGTKALPRIVSISSGTFTFKPQIDSTIEKSGPVDIPSQKLILDTVRQVDEIELLLHRLPHPSVQLIVSDSLDTSPLESRDIAILRAIKRHGTVGKILDSVPLPDVEVLRTLNRLSMAGAFLTET